MTDQKVDEGTGRVKKAPSSLTDDKELKNEGKADQAASSVKKRVEHAVILVKEKFTGGDKK